MDRRGPTIRADDDFGIGSNRNPLGLSPIAPRHTFGITDRRIPQREDASDQNPETPRSYRQHRR